MMLDPFTTSAITYLASTTGFWTGFGIGGTVVGAVGGYFGYQKIKAADSRAAKAEEKLKRLHKFESSAHKVSALSQKKQSASALTMSKAPPALFSNAPPSKENNDIYSPKARLATPPSAAFLKRFS